MQHVTQKKFYTDASLQQQSFHPRRYSDLIDIFYGNQ